MVAGDNPGEGLGTLPVPGRFALLIHRLLANMGEDGLKEQIARHFGAEGDGSGGGGGTTTSKPHAHFEGDSPSKSDATTPAPPPPFWVREAEVHAAVERFFAPV